MRQAYRMLLRLYPSEHRFQFEEEMVAVFTLAAEERQAQGWLAYTRFLVNECFGLLSGACGERSTSMSLAPALGGITAAAALHAAFYAAVLKVLNAIAAAVGHSTIPSAEPQAAALTLSILGVISLLCLLPLFFLLSMRLMKRRR